MIRRICADHDREESDGGQDDRKDHVDGDGIQVSPECRKSGAHAVNGRAQPSARASAGRLISTRRKDQPIG
jgi:hypothetical protein